MAASSFRRPAAESREYESSRRLVTTLGVCTLPATLVMLSSVDFLEGDFPLPFVLPLVTAACVAPACFVARAVGRRRWIDDEPLGRVLVAQWAPPLAAVALVFLSMGAVAADLLSSPS